jgi:hypothetical protein
VAACWLFVPILVVLLAPNIPVWLSISWQTDRDPAYDDLSSHACRSSSAGNVTFTHARG